MEIQERMQDIINEYAQIVHDIGDISLEHVGEDGDVRVVLTKITDKGKRTATRHIAYDEPLDFISETFHYPNTFTPRSRDISLEDVKMAYFNDLGDLIVERESAYFGTTEGFKVKHEQMDEVAEILRVKLGKKFKG